MSGSFEALKETQYDVCIVGASVAGCCAALLYARQNLNVLLIDKKKSVSESKKACTTYIQKSAAPVMRELGLERQLLETSAMANSCDIWTKHGWIAGKLPKTDNRDLDHGYCVRRSDLDPLMLTRAMAHPKVHVELGCQIDDLIMQDGLVRGVKIQQLSDTTEVLVKLVVGADGRHSKVASLLKGKEKIIENDRFAKFAFYKNIELNANGKSLFWVLEPETVFLYPYTNDETLVCGFFDQANAKKINSNADEHFRSVMQSLPDGPDVSKAERVTDFVSAIKIKNIYRDPALKGCALIGDAALAGDPMAGIGCGWALQSAKMLVDATALQVHDEKSLLKSLKRYRRKHRSHFTGHFYFISDASKLRNMNAIENMLMKAAVNNADIADMFHNFIARDISPLKAFSLRNIGKIISVNLKLAYDAYKSNKVSAATGGLISKKMS